MQHIQTKMLFLCLVALLFVTACADTSKKEAAETPTQTVAANVEEVTLTVTGMA